jgi:hypothetical protein
MIVCNIFTIASSNMKCDQSEIQSKSTNFWDITPCSPLRVNRRFGGTYRLHLPWFFAELISSTLKMEKICSSETSVDTQRITRCYIPEDVTLHNYRCENFKSYSDSITYVLILESDFLWSLFKYRYHHWITCALKHLWFPSCVYKSCDTMHIKL